VDQSIGDLDLTGTITLSFNGVVMAESLAILNVVAILVGSVVLGFLYKSIDGLKNGIEAQRIVIDSLKTHLDYVDGVRGVVSKLFDPAELEKAVAIKVEGKLKPINDDLERTRKALNIYQQELHTLRADRENADKQKEQLLKQTTVADDAIQAFSVSIDEYQKMLNTMYFVVVYASIEMTDDQYEEILKVIGRKMKGSERDRLIEIMNETRPRFRTAPPSSARGVGSPIRLFVNYEVNNILPLAREVD
jgi:hypothetical protein